MVCVVRVLMSYLVCQSTVWFITLCLIFSCGSLAAHSRSFEMPRCRTVQFSRSFFYLVFDCGMGCMNQSLIVKVWVLLNFSQSLFFTRLTPLFLPSLSFFLFPGPKIAWGSLDLYRLFDFIHVVFGPVFLGAVLVGSHVCVFRHRVRHLRLAMQSQSDRKLRFHFLE